MQLMYVPTKDEIRKMVPKTKAKYGVYFGLKQHETVSIKRISCKTPKTLDLAILQILQYEANFLHLEVRGRLFDLDSGEEVFFCRTVPFQLVQDSRTKYEPSIN